MTTAEPVRTVSTSRGPRHRSRRLLVAALLLLSLPSCFTAKLWDMDQFGPDVLLDSHPIDGTLQAQIVGDVAQRLRVVTDSALGSIDLQPRRGAHEIPALLRRGDLFQVKRAELSGTVRTYVDELQPCQVQLKLTGRIRAGAWHRYVAMHELPAAVRTQLSALGTPPTRHLPLALRGCAERLLAMHTETLLPETGTGATVATFAFTNGAGEVIPTHGSGAPSNGTFGYRWYSEQIQGHTLYAVLRNGTEQHVVRIDPDAFWLLSELRQQDDRIVLESHWSVTQVDRGAPGSQAPSLSLSAQLDVETYAPHQQSFGTRALQVALTPVAVAADLTITPILFVGFMLFVDTSKLC